MAASDPAEYGGIKRAKAGCGCFLCKVALAAFRRDMAIENGHAPAPLGWDQRPAARVAALMTDGWRP